MVQRCQRRGVAIPPPYPIRPAPSSTPPRPTKGSMVATDHSRTPNARQCAGNFNETLSLSLSLLPLISAGSALLPPSSSRFRNTRMAAGIFAFREEGVDDALDELTLSKRGREKWRVSTKRFIVFISWKGSSC